MKLLACCCSLLVSVTAACGLTTVKVQPVTVEPIHMTIDVNVHDQGSNGSPTADEGKPPK